ncbi:MAG: hypothetical protein AAGI07_18485 [Bacteroidota bacterium]
MVNPSRLLLLLFYVGLMSGLVMLLSPEKLSLPSNTILKVFTWNDAFGQPKPKVDISNIVALEASVKKEEEEASSEKGITEVSKIINYQEDVSEKLRSFKVHIQFPKGKENALDNFFAELRDLSSKNELIRIIHYGDSQLEGDRISDYLRNRFQKRFGGCGIGLAPLTLVNNVSSTFWQKTSENWVRYSTYGAERKQPTHKYYGLLGHYFSLYDYELNPSSPYKGWSQFSRNAKTYKRFNAVEQVTLLYRNRKAPLHLKLTLNGVKSADEDLPISNKLTMRKFKLNGNFQKAKFELSSNGAPDLYVVAFDCQRGIALDNVAMRGSSGIEFTQINRNFYREQIKKLNVKFLIVQFGVNVIPNITEDYGFYRYSLAKQLKYLKSLNPGLDILVVGVSDMSRKEGTDYESYPNVKLVRDAQKAAAFDAGCAFWDLYQAMGGENAMVSWVNADPPMGHTDYTHFTPRGAKLVAEMMYSEIMRAYEGYKTRTIVQ